MRRTYALAKRLRVASATPYDFVKRVEHTLGSSGFFTDFTARRIHDGGTTP